MNDVEDNIVGPSGKGGLTSWLASLENAKRNGGQRLRVLDAFERWGAMTDEEVQERLLLSANAERPRRIELARGGLIAECGHGQTRCGNKAVRWQITSEGRVVIARRRRAEREVAA